MDNELNKAALYLEEWKHRDNMLIKYIFSFFSSIVVVSLIPYVNFRDNTLISVIDPYLFNIVGIVLSFLAMFVTIRMGNRLSEIGDKYRKCIGDYNKERATEIRFSNVLPTGLYSLLIFMNLYLFIKSVL